MMDNCPKLTVHLNLSLDGIGATHDAIRGVPGGFDKTMKTIEAVTERFDGHPRVHVNVATVVTPDGLPELLDLASLLLGRFNLATHFFEAVRGAPRDAATKEISRQQLEALHLSLMPYYEAMAARLFGKLPGPARLLAVMFFVGVIRALYDIQERNLKGPSPWGMCCTAGKTTLVMDHDGSMRSCELRPPFSTIQSFDLDLSAALRSRALKEEIEAVGGGGGANCWCTHTCWMLASMQFSKKTLLWEVPRAFLRVKRQGLPKVDASQLDWRAILSKHQLSSSLE